jgi:hypothetical protein
MFLKTVNYGDDGLEIKTIGLGTDGEIIGFCRKDASSNLEKTRKRRLLQNHYVHLAKNIQPDEY